MGELLLANEKPPLLLQLSLDLEISSPGFVRRQHYKSIVDFTLICGVLTGAHNFISLQLFLNSYGFLPVISSHF